MEKDHPPYKCTKCALQITCDYHQPANCQHFRRIGEPQPMPAPSAQAEPTEAEIARAFLHVRARRFVLFWEIVFGAIWGVMASMIPALVVIVIFQNPSMSSGITLLLLVSRCVGSFVAGFRAALYSTKPQQWRHAAILSLIHVSNLTGSTVAHLVIQLLIPSACVFWGAQCTRYVPRIPLLNRIRLPFPK